MCLVDLVETFAGVGGLAEHVGDFLFLSLQIRSQPLSSITKIHGRYLYLRIHILCLQDAIAEIPVSGRHLLSSLPSPQRTGRAELDISRLLRGRRQQANSSPCFESELRCPDCRYLHKLLCHEWICLGRPRVWVRMLLRLPLTQGGYEAA